MPSPREPPPPQKPKPGDPGLYPKGSKSDQGQGVFPCAVCGLWIEETKKTTVKDYSRRSEYKGNAEYFHCGETDCGLEPQSRVDGEEMFASMWTIRRGLDMQVSRWTKNYKSEVHQDNPYTKMMRDMHQTREKIENFFTEAEFDPEWVADEQ